MSNRFLLWWKERKKANSPKVLCVSLCSYECGRSILSRSFFFYHNGFTTRCVIKFQVCNGNSGHFICYVCSVRLWVREWILPASLLKDIYQGLALGSKKRDVPLIHPHMGNSLSFSFSPLKSNSFAIGALSLDSPVGRERVFFSFSVSFLSSLPLVSLFFDNAVLV